MSTETMFTLKTELSSPMPAAALRAFLDAAERAMDDVTVEARLSEAMPGHVLTTLTATGTAKDRPRPVYRNRGEE